MAVAAALTWPARARSRFLVSRWAGPLTPTAATELPLSSLIGEAMP
ncbi:MAG: hypothetical protein QOI88_1162, partial [Gammaproteobacteria bacterium]|nr:hypothetical protein [Gammaproteobacteria bacterium]